MNNVLKIGAIALATTLLAACSDDDNDDEPVTEVTTPVVVEPDTAIYDITITNLTNAQPLSPVAIMLHNSGFNSFIDGQTSSVALELLAEGGNNADVLSEVQAATQHVASASTQGPIPPTTISEVVSLLVPGEERDDLHLSVISMLVRTNDAFTGLNAVNISDMALGDSITFNGPTWDSGTEANTETGATMPGPGFDGEGFNAARDDIIDVVRFHGGVVSNESEEFGLATSDLNETHRFDNPTSRITLTRSQ